jgi:uncharacterized protein (DUF1697 family)
MRYAVFLRAINIGKLNRLSMPDFCVVCESLELECLSTHGQTGNAVLETPLEDAERIAADLEGALLERGMKGVHVVVRDRAQLHELARVQPFTNNPDEIQYITLLRHPSSRVLPPLPPEKNLEIRLITLDAIFTSVPRGVQYTAPNAFIESKLKVSATTRYWSVVQTLCDANL